MNYINIWPDYEYDALMPDVIIYRTVEDFVNNHDAVMEFVRHPPCPV